MAIKKYTPEVIKSKLSTMLLALNDNKDIVFLNELLISVNLNTNTYGNIKSDNNQDDEIKYLIKTIDNILEQRLVVGALYNKLNTSMAVFILKNKYGYSDKQVIDNTHKVIPILSGASNALAPPDATPKA